MASIGLEEWGGLGLIASLSIPLGLPSPPHTGTKLWCNPLHQALSPAHDFLNIGRPVVSTEKTSLALNWECHDHLCSCSVCSEHQLQLTAALFRSWQTGKTLAPQQTRTACLPAPGLDRQGFH